MPVLQAQSFTVSVVAERLREGILDPGPSDGQEQAGSHVELPQLHRRRAFPPPVLILASAPRHRLEQPVPH
jgi:hypothetical protein